MAVGAGQLLVGQLLEHRVEGAGGRTVKAQLVPFDDLIRQKLGLVLLNLTAQTAASYPVKRGQGLFIEGVEKQSPADKVQLQRGFLLTAIPNWTGV